MNTKKLAFLMISLFIISLSVSNVAAANYNVNSLADVSGITSWLTGGATAGDTLFFNLNPSDIINSLSNIVINVSINIVSNTGTIIQGTTANNLFTITANNVNISGLTVNGFNQAITVSGANQSTIQNNSFNNNTGSVAVYNSNGSKVSNNTIKNNGNNNAIGLGNSNYTKIEGNNIENNTGTAIATWDSHDNEIRNNKIDTVSNGEGIYVKGDNHVIESNEVSNANNGIYVEGASGKNSTNLKISNNKVSKNKYQGIYVSRLSSSVISNNQINNNNNNGIDMSYSGNIQIINNTCNFNGNNSSYTNIRQNNGIYVSYSNSKVTINNNTAEGNLRNGLTIYDDSYHNNEPFEIFNNFFGNNNENGIYSSYTNTSSNVYNNTIYSNGHSGIAALGFAANFFNNVIKDNGYSGIYVSGNNPLYSTIRNNTISNNTEGLYIRSSKLNITKNNIIGNSIGLLLNGSYQNITNISFEYNRIVNSTKNLNIVYNTDLYYPTVITNNSGNFNWWGSNDPEDSIFQNNSAFNASYWFVTNLTSIQDSVNKTDSARFNYTIGLNDPTILAGSMKLPHFTFNVDGKSYDARKNQVLSKVYDETGDHVFGFFVDNQWLEAKVKVIDIPGPNPTPNNTTNNTNHTNHTNGTGVGNGTGSGINAGASMKDTGIPLFAVLIALISTIGVVFRKKL